MATPRRPEWLTLTKSTRPANSNKPSEVAAPRDHHTSLAVFKELRSRGCGRLLGLPRARRLPRATLGRTSRGVGLSPFARRSGLPMDLGHGGDLDGFGGRGFGPSGLRRSGVARRDRKLLRQCVGFFHHRTRCGHGDGSIGPPEVGRGSRLGLDHSSVARGVWWPSRRLRRRRRNGEDPRGTPPGGLQLDQTFTLCLVEEVKDAAEAVAALVEVLVKRPHSLPDLA